MRGMIMMSLSMQVILIFLAPLRKRCSKWWIVMLTWSAYLVADWVADYAFGLIAKAQYTGVASKSKVDDADLLAFWAPFLLLHLGGPDTITAFALEDNELWGRHLLNLLFQLGAAGYVFYQSLPNNKLIVPTVLVFIGGLIKYIERTCALYLGSFSKFRAHLLKSADPGPNYAKLMEEFSSKKEANIPTEIVMMPEPPIKSQDEEKTGGTPWDDRQAIVAASRYFTTFKGLLVDLIFSFGDRDQSMKFFSSRNSKEAFQVIEVELNFFYYVLYTKAAIVYCPRGYLFRAISFGSVITAFALFYVLNKHGFHPYDIRITYTLLLGAVGLEFVALITLICSDWTIASLGRSEKRSTSFSVSCFIDFLLKFKSQFDRWSKSIFQHNLIDSQLKKWPHWIEKLPGFTSLEEWFHDLNPGPGTTYRDELGELIFNELKRKSSDASDSKSIKEMCAARGEWALKNSKTKQNCSKLLPFIRDVDYGESLVLWHIATELHYNKDKSTNPHRESSGTNPHLESKVLSDYMIYLMIKQPNMMSAVAGIGQLRFRDTCAEMDKFIRDISDGSTTKITKEEACKSLLAVPTEVTPADVKGDRSKSALFDACILAKALLEPEFEETKWVIMSEVWVELLGYAAIHCQPVMHAQRLGKGGELVTLVWLLMVRLGLSDRFQIIEGHARAKLIVQK
ncbi:DUF4220 domain-containing protein [Psidium guajava]|nr:DUF4220 domain-containing protein [Psidium guajava]